MMDRSNSDTFSYKTESVELVVKLKTSSMVFIEPERIEEQLRHHIHTNAKTARSKEL